MASLIPRCFSFINTSMRFQQPVRTLVAYTRLTPAAVHHVGNRQNVGYRIGGCILGLLSLIIPSLDPFVSHLIMGLERTHLLLTKRIPEKLSQVMKPLLNPHCSSDSSRCTRTTGNKYYLCIFWKLLLNFLIQFCRYVLIPVHCVTSAGWATIFYFSVKK